MSGEKPQLIAISFAAEPDRWYSFGSQIIMANLMLGSTQVRPQALESSNFRLLRSWLWLCTHELLCMCVEGSTNRCSYMVPQKPPDPFLARNQHLGTSKNPVTTAKPGVDYNFAGSGRVFRLLFPSTILDVKRRSRGRSKHNLCEFKCMRVAKDKDYPALRYLWTFRSVPRGPANNLTSLVPIARFQRENWIKKTCMVKISDHVI